MDKSGAESQARELNRALGEANVTNAFFIAVEERRGTWRVERVTEPPKRYALLRTLLNPLNW